jgi:hypothetical protein
MKCNLNNRYGKKKPKHRSWLERKIYSIARQIKFLNYIACLSSYYLEECVEEKIERAA